MSIFAWIMAGLVAAWLAALVMGGEGQGLLVDIVMGILGALLAGLIAASLLGFPGAVDRINLGSILAAFLGGILMIGLLRGFAPGTRV